MARRPKPWFRKARKAWFVQIAGVQHNLGPDENQAYEQFHQLMRQPARQNVSPHSFAAIAEAFMEWVQNQRELESPAKLTDESHYVDSAPVRPTRKIPPKIKLGRPLAWRSALHGQ